jgi:uncharacterized protein YbjT (DUF2867 family)
MTTETPDAPILVTGATGKQGGATARRLLAGGWPVRAMVRDVTTPAATALAAAGAQLILGDFDDPASLPPALDGAAAVFGDPGRRLPVRRPRVAYHIALSTVLRPVRFMTNYLGVGVLGIDGLSHGVHRHLFSPHEPMQIIALEDIAEFAALAFADPTRFTGRTLELAGDQPTPVEAAAAITEATGIPIKYEQLTEAEAAAINPEIADVRARWQAGQRWHADIEALRVIHPGLRTITDWLRESGAKAIRAQLRD